MKQKKKRSIFFVLLLNFETSFERVFELNGSAVDHTSCTLIRTTVRVPEERRTETTDPDTKVRLAGFHSLGDFKVNTSNYKLSWKTHLRLRGARVFTLVGVVFFLFFGQSSGTGT